MKRQTCSSTKKREEIKKENLAEPKKNRKTLQLLTLSSEHQKEILHKLVLYEVRKYKRNA